VQRNRRLEVFQLLAESVREAREAAAIISLRPAKLGFGLFWKEDGQSNKNQEINSSYNIGRF
jgi:hypothetical protein